MGKLLFSYVLAGVAFVGLVSFWAVQSIGTSRVFRRVKAGEIAP